MNKFLNKLWDILVFLMDLFIRRICHIKITDEKWQGFLQFVKFGMVGVSNTLIQYLIYLLFLFLGFHYLAANVIGFFASVINAFYWNNKYVFVKKENEVRTVWQAFLKTFLSYAGTGLVLENVLLTVWVGMLHISEILAPAVTLLLTVPINFILNKFWAFRDKKKEKDT